ncbi:hypothetical protein ECG_01207 [Echinococcus granulosus]|uniref:Uncharacterized protein n=1 Tax=Echinococcus granulosus TaxID=6210 RepID=A0A068WE51_ECHGR|nr:hypothetical protein ECG_01207 [Echinococcus granulosus]CDS15897.1 hypothetical protein EgrG_000830200 [Echinococcus granulosus]
MPLTYWTSTPFLLKGLYHGSFQQSLLYQILFFFSLAVSLPCDPSTLPRGVRISQNGPVLKLTCDSGLQPLEMAHFTSSAGLLLPIPSKRKFARYVCVNGASYQRINSQGIERSFFFCTDGQSNLCDPLENSAEHGHLQVEGTVAIWRSVTGSQRSVLYCAHGVWHRLGGGPLPYGVTVKSQQKEKFLSTPGTTASTTAGASNGEIITTISATVPFPSSHPTTTPVNSIVELLHLPSRLLPPPSSPPAHVSCTTPKSHLRLSEESSLDPKSAGQLHIPTANIILFAESVSLALHDRFHRCARMALYCMIFIATGALIASLLVLMLVCRRARLTANVVQVQERLKNTIASV